MVQLLLLLVRRMMADVSIALNNNNNRVEHQHQHQQEKQRRQSDNVFVDLAAAKSFISAVFPR